MSNDEIKSRVFGAVKESQLRSAGTKKMEKMTKVVTHIEQLEKVLINWSDPKNDRPAHSVANLLMAMNKSSGVMLTEEQLSAAIPSEVMTQLMNRYMDWQVATEEAIRQFVAKPADIAKGNVQQKAQSVELSEIEQLQMALGKAVVAKDKELQKSIMQQLADLS